MTGHHHRNIPVILRLLSLVILLFSINAGAQSQQHLDGFSEWRTGKDEQTRQLLPASGTNPLHRRGRQTVASMKFDVVHYGEMSFPIRATGAVEAVAVDLSGCRYIEVEYRANQPLILQLRQAGVHGGVQNHIELPAAKKYRKTTIEFSSFTGGLAPLDLRTVAKFNFAFLSNNATDGFASLDVRAFRIDGYDPVK